MGWKPNQMAILCRKTLEDAPFSKVIMKSLVSTMISEKPRDNYFSVAKAD